MFLDIQTIRDFLLENMLKWRTDSDTNLTNVCRHRWSRKTAMNADKY
jgi:hypothetical protein